MAKPDSPEELKSMRRLAELQLKIKDLLAKEVGINPDANDFPFEYFISLQDMTTRISSYSGNGCPVCASIEIVRWVVMNGLKHIDVENLAEAETNGVH